ncbi:MAG: hypothetical protein K0S04_3141 [Herbinix sp.]|nr:hypothetical protein [Herbinix sp.]
MKKIVTIFSCLLLPLSIHTTASAADIIPNLTTENDFFYGILLVALLVIFLLLGLLLGRITGRSNNARKEEIMPTLDESKPTPTNSNTLGQDLSQKEQIRDAQPIPRNPRSRYYNYW